MKILLVSYFFPPSNIVGVYRVVALANYLVKSGNDCSVLSAREDYYPVKDRELLEKVDRRVKIIRTSSWERKKKVDPAKTRNTRNIFRAAIQYIYSRILYTLCLIDYQVFWFIPLKKELRRLLCDREKGFDLVIVSAPPFSSFIPSVQEAGNAGVPIVLDFRDPWTHNQNRRFPTPLHRWINRVFEKKAVCSADRIVSAQAHNYWKEWGVVDEKVIGVLNGWSREDFQNMKPDGGCLIPGKINIGYMGSFYGDYTPYAVTHFLDWVREVDRTLFDKVFFHFVGHMNFRTRSLFRKFRLEDKCRFYGLQPKATALRMVSAMDVLLLMYPAGYDRTGQTYPAKFFEYLPMKKPLLAILPPSLAGKLVTKYNAGLYIDINHYNSSEDKTAIFQKIREFLQGGYRESGTIPDEEIDKYERDVQFSRLLEELEKRYGDEAGS